MRIRLISMFILVLHFLGNAQSSTKPPGVGSGGGNEGASRQNPTSGLSIIFGNTDSLSAQYFTLDNLESLHTFDPISEMHPSAQYDPIKLEPVDYVNIGNMGSSSFPIHYSWKSNINFDLGYHQFDVYKKSLKNTRLVQSNVPLSNLGFSPLSGRQNFIVDALFSNSYKEELLLNIDYRRINQDGYFFNQITRATNVGFHLYWTPKSSYRALLSLFVNNNGEGQNGGITTDTLFGQDFFENLINIPVFSQDASSRYQDRSFLINQFYSLTQDSSLLRVNLHHEIEYQTGYYRYFDNTIEESEYIRYPQFVTDDRGLRHIIQFNRFKNKFDFETSMRDNIVLLSGLSQNYFSSEDEVIDFSVNEISVYGDLRIRLREQFQLQSKLELGLVSNNGNLAFESIAQIQLPAENKIEGGFNFSRYASSYVHRNLNITQTQVWETEFAKQIESEFWASLFLGKLNTKITVSQMLLDNIIYLTDDQTYFQNPDILSFSKLLIENKFKLKNIHLDNTFLLQSFSDNIFNFPNYWSRHILYVNTPLFGEVVDANIGVEARLSPSRNLRFYHPILGDVYSINEKTDFYPELSLFSVFDVSDFRVFVRAENVFHAISSDLQYHFQSYPQNELKIRFGFRWLLAN